MADYGNYIAINRPCSINRAAQTNQVVCIYNFPLGGGPRGLFGFFYLTEN